MKSFVHPKGVVKQGPSLDVVARRDIAARGIVQEVGTAAAKG